MLTIISVTLAEAALTAHAQPPPGGRPPHRPPPLFEALDTNHDGVIDADEIANASKALLTLDKNGDGQLTKDELRPPRPPMPPGGEPSVSGTSSQNEPGEKLRPPRHHRETENGGGPGQGNPFHHPPGPIMEALDANHDGVIDASEIANASAALKTLDKNGDGKLTMDELMPPRPDQAGQGTNQNPPPPPDGNPPPPPPDAASSPAQ